MSKDVRKALMIAKGPVSSGYLPPGDPQRTANLARFMEGSVAPPTLYHGTLVHAAPRGTNTRPLGDIDQFDRYAAYKAFNRPEGMDAVGTWLDENPGKTGAGMYAGSEGAIYPVNPSLKNPWKPKSFDEFLDLMHTTAGRNPKAQNPKGRGTVGPLRDYLMSKGHDSIMFPPGAVDHPDQGPVWVALHPERQLKSAIGNRGTFDLNEPDITKAEGGAVASGNLGLMQGDPSALKMAQGMDYGAQQEEQFNSAWDQDNPYVAPTPPEGLNPANGVATQELVNWYNEKTGQRYTASSGGWSAEPGSGWRQVKSDSYDDQGKLVSQDPINMPGFVGPTYSAPSTPTAPSTPAAPSTPNPVTNYQTVGTTPTSPVYGATPPTTPPSTTTTTPAPPPATPTTPAPPPVLGTTTPAPVNGTPQPVQPVPGMVAPSPQSPPPVLGATTPAPINGTPQPVQVPTDNSYGITRTNAKAKGGAVEETVPEAPYTLESQLQAFLQGKRKAVLYTHDEPELPKGAGRLETAHGVFHYNPALIDERSIKAAVAGDRINEILGYGPYSKRDVLNRVAQGESPLAVVGRDAGGREVLSAAGTDKTAHEQASAIAAQLPTGGQVHIESPQQVISERIAALRSPEQGNKDARKALMIARAKGEQPIHYAYGGPVEGDRELDQSGFYNAAAEAAKGIPQAKGTPQQMMSMVQKVPGTQESIKWSGADHAFAGQPIVSKGDLVKHFQTNAPKLEETQLGGRQSNMETKYHKYTIPGGENYREVLLQAPLNKSPERDRMSAIDERRHAIEKELMKLNDEELDKHISTQGIANVDDIMMQKMHLLSEQENLRSEYKDLVPKTWNLDYKSPHWYNKPNLVAHLRMSDRTLPQTGEKALHLEELQSDWGQAGRAGFKKSPEELASMKADMLAAHKNFLNLIGPVSGATEDQIQAAEDKSKAVMNKWNEASKATTPEGPYVGSTAKWTELGLKRALIEAARNGHDKLVWTPGQDQADRYDLSQQVKQILVENHGGKFHVKAYDHDGSKVINEHVDTPEEIARLIGKEAADKAMEHMESSRNAGSHIPRADLRGVDLKVGGEGMKGYYDKIVPTALARIVKSIGHTPEFGTDYIQGRKDDRDLVLINRRGQYHVETPDMHNNEGNWQDGEHVAGPFATREEADAHRTNLYKGLKAVPSLKITPAMRETISKGLPRKTGGFVPPARSSAVEQALKLTSKSGATLPAAVFLARQHQRRN